MSDKIWLQYIGQRDASFGIVGESTGTSYNIDGPGFKLEVYKSDLARFSTRDFTRYVDPPTNEVPQVQQVYIQEARAMPGETALGELANIDARDGINDREFDIMHRYLADYWEQNDISKLKSIGNERDVARLRVGGSLTVVRDIIGLGIEKLSWFIPHEKAVEVMKEAKEFERAMHNE